LHQLLSPSAEAVRDCLSLLADGDCVVLVDRGVEMLARQDGLAALAGILWFALAEDVAARGLAKSAESYPGRLLDTPGWLELIVRHPQVLSWT
jgi:sulfur relay protein TusB/DsrH